MTAGNAYSTGIQSGIGPAKIEISLNGLKSSANQILVNLNGAGTDATSATRSGTAAAAAGIFDLSGSAGAGAAINLVIDGTHSITATLGNSATQDAIGLAGTINTALGANGTASVDAAGHIVIKSATTGATSSVEVLATSDAGLTTALGLNPAAAVQRGASASEGNVLNQINTAIAANSTLTNAGLQAKDDGTGKVQIVSNNDTYFRVNSFGPGDIGFGNVGSSFTGTAQSAAPATSQYFDSQGASATNALAYNDTLFGSDKQTIAVTGLDTAGAKHSLGITLENDSTTRNQTIDQALNQINSKLQQSNDTTLQSIVAVKDSSGGAQSIRFLSTLSNFQVSVASDKGGTGITPPTGSVASATTLGTGLTSSVDSQTNAEAAVNALSKSVALLGKAQAVVGRGQNQFNYAVNLAQSQLTNLAAAESRIRDADLAAEAANLTKSQILVQAGVAALSQANSAPQQILSLLRG